MSERLSTLVKLILEYGDTEDIRDALELEEAEPEELPLQVMRYFLNNDPYDAIAELIGTKRKLRAIVYGMAKEIELDINIPDSATRNELIQQILSVNLENVYPSDLHTTGFYVSQKLLKKSMNLPREDRYAKVLRAVHQIEFMIKRVYLFVIENNLEWILLQEGFKKPSTKPFLSLKSAIDALVSAENIAGNSLSVQNETLRIFGRNTPFPDIDNQLLIKFKDLRNAKFGHQTVPRFTEEDERKAADEMHPLATTVCEMFQRFAPKIVIQIHYIQDNLKRNRIFYIEEENDFDHNGRLNSEFYLVQERRWDLRSCSYYCTTINSINSYHPGTPAFLLPVPASDRQTPFVDPDFFSVEELSRWERIVEDEQNALVEEE